MNRLLTVGLWRVAAPALTFIISSATVALSSDERQLAIFQIFVLQMLVNSLEYPYFIAAKKDKTLSTPFALISTAVVFGVSTFFGNNLIGILYSTNLLMALIIFSPLFKIEEYSSLNHTLAVGVFRTLTINAIFLLAVFRREIELVLMFVVLFTTIIVKRTSKGEELPLREASWYFAAAIAVACIFNVDRTILLKSTHARVANALIILSAVISTIGSIASVYSYRTAEEKLGRRFLFAAVSASIGVGVVYTTGGFLMSVPFAFLSVPLLNASVAPLLFKLQLEKIQLVAIPLLIFLLIKLILQKINPGCDVVKIITMLFSLAPAVLSTLIAIKLRGYKDISQNTFSAGTT